MKESKQLTQSIIDSQESSREEMERALNPKFDALIRALPHQRV